MKKIIVPKNTQIAVFSDPHEHSEQFFKLMDKINPSENMWIVCAGDKNDKGFGEKAFHDILDRMIEYSNAGFGFSVKGNHCLKFLKKNKQDNSSRITWLRARPLSLSFEFYNGSRLTVLHGGVTNKTTEEDLQNNIEICYVRDIDDSGKMIPMVWKDIKGEKTLVKSKEGGKFWMDLYDGRFGFIAAGHTPNKNGKPSYYNYSVNLDCGVFETGQLVGQIFTSEGKLGEQITVSGTPFKPKLNIKE